MQGETFYDDVRSQPELIEQYNAQHETAESERLRRDDINRRRKPGPERDEEEARLHFHISRLDYVAMRIHFDRHGRELPMFGG
jgi:hypothetical protein